MFSTCAFVTTIAWPAFFAHQRALIQAVVVGPRKTTSDCAVQGSRSSPRTTAQNGQS
jgi:hypothetical protein